MAKNILSTHYEGLAVVSHTPKIEPKDHKSMQFRNLTVSSYPWGATTQHLDGRNVLTVTANNTFSTSAADYAKNGYFSQVDDGARRDGIQFPAFESWKAAGEDVKPSMFNLIPVMPNIAYITGATPLGMYLPSNRDTPVNLQVTPRLVEAVAPNEMGIYVSKKADQYRTLRNLTFTDANELNPISVSWIDFLGNRGYSLSKGKSKGIVGLGVENAKFIAALYPKQGYLVSNSKFHEIVSRRANEYGLSDSEGMEAAKSAVMLHEFAHFLGVEGNRKGEETQGLLQAEFYAMLANNFKGTKWEKIYRALARQGRDYAKRFSLNNLLLGKLPDSSGDNEQLEKLVDKFVAEAGALELDEESTKEYVAKRLERTYGNLLRDEERHSRLSEKSNPGDLEAIVRGERSSKDARSEKAEANEKAEEAPSEAAE